MEYLYTPRYCYISPLCFTAQRKLEVHVPLLPCCFMVVLGQGLPEPAGVPGVWIQYRPHVQYGLEGGHVRISYFPFLGESLAGHPDSAAGNTTSLRISL